MNEISRACLLALFTAQFGLGFPLSLPHAKVYQNIRYQPGPCHKNQSRFPFIYDRTKIKLAGGVNSVFINFNLELSMDMHAPIGLTIEITRCSLSDKSYCTRAHDLMFPDVCAFAEQTKTITDFFMAPVNVIEPPLECPIQKQGKYFIHNYTFDLTSLAVLPLEGFCWKVRLIHFYGLEKEDLLCVEIEANVRRVNQKAKKDGKKI